MTLKITNSTLQPHLPGANELRLQPIKYGLLINRCLLVANEVHILFRLMFLVDGLFPVGVNKSFLLFFWTRLCKKITQVKVNQFSFSEPASPRKSHRWQSINFLFLNLPLQKITQIKASPSFLLFFLISEPTSARKPNRWNSNFLLFLTHCPLDDLHEIDEK